MTDLDDCDCKKVVSKPYTNLDKWIVSIVAGFLFFILASPLLFKVISSTGLPATTFYGNPTTIGLVIMSIIYILMTRLLMR